LDVRLRSAIAAWYFTRVAQKPRIEFPGAVHHVTTRGNDGREIVRDALDARHLLRLIGRVVERHGWLCHAFCVLGNHFHLVLQTPAPNLADGMRVLNGQYARGFNERYGSTGHVFGARYRAALVDADSHLLEAIRYVDLNPVRAGACRRPEDWPWSSYRATAGLAPRGFVCVERVLRLFAEDAREGRSRFVAFVADGYSA
jgi:REP element-mobilizing transposase RayT